MAAPKGNRFRRKYPASFTYLPAGLGEAHSDNTKLLNLGGVIYSEPFKVLEPSQEALGVNTKSVKISTTIAAGEIYIIWAIGTTLYKIGVSTNFARRFKDLSAASPLPLTTVKYGYCDNPHLLESHLHSMFAHKLFKNEWFSLGQDEIDAADAVFDRYFEVARKPQ